MKRVIIENLGTGGHSTVETDLASATVLLADEMARGCIIYCRDTQQRLEKEEDLGSLGNTEGESVRVMVIPPVAGG